MKFYIASKFGIENLNEIDVTLAVSHFHDVVISKEGHSEGQNILLDIRYKGHALHFDKEELLKACMISMPVDQKRNMMNASSNFNIIYSIISAITEKKKVKFHTPGVNGEIGGYPFIVDATGDVISSYIDESVFFLDEMRKANRESIYKDGISNVEKATLYYTPELVKKVNEVFSVVIPSCVKYDEIDVVGKFIIDKIILLNTKI